MNLYKYTSHELNNKLKNKEISATEICSDIIARIDKVEDKVKSYITLTPNEALAKASQIDEKISKNPKYLEEKSSLAGIPGAIKDNICTQGIKTTCASKFLENFIPPYSATVIENLLNEDSAIIGKVNLDEFAMGSSTENSGVGPSKNPWDLERVPGGSSGGSASAVAAGTAIWALGSDTGGSIRQPASYCGVVGLKPTYGRVSRYGAVAYASSLDQIGTLTKDVRDAAALMNIIAGYDTKDSNSINMPVPDYQKSLTTDIKGLKIGLPKEYFTDGIEPEVLKAVENAIADLKSLGAEFKEINLPHTEYALAVYYIIATAEASANLARFDGVNFGYRTNSECEDLFEMYLKTRNEGFGAEVKRRIMLGTYVLSSGYYDAYYIKALKMRTLVKRDFDLAFENVDVILTPTVPTTAFKIGEKLHDPLAMYLQDVYTIPVNLSGIPAISIPCGFTETNLPIGLQIMGKPLAEETILKTAYAFEQTHDYHKMSASIKGVD